MNRFVPGFLLLGLLIGLLKLSFDLSLANIHLHRAQNFLATKEGYLPTASQLNLAQAEIHQALAVAPSDANNLDLAGRISYLSANYSGSEPDRDSKLNKAIAWHQNALEERVNWPYSYVNLLYAMAAQQRLDSEFQMLFHEAYKLGMDDKAVVRDLVYLGVKNWLLLDNETQDLTAKLTEAALKNGILSERSFRPFLQAESQFHRICAHLSQFEEKTALCNAG